ncbi:MAG: bifunctional homocysteine S-methyltransferase/methylenetetrahydrofolate reductase [Lachnospiraceae bacterium]|nr:bifunctional homocysteine S-methyltransferase/methylenetetrahydrofolate reductase [Lachnospiraceae bacterium]
MSVEKLSEVLSREKLLCDGAFGTYYALKYDTEELPERANVAHPERVVQIHREYIEAGAQILRTNTYASNTVMLHEDMQRVRENLRCGYACAKEARNNNQTVHVAADIGPIPCDTPAEKELARREYIAICETFLAEGATLFIFETFASLEDILPAIEVIGENAFVIVQFAVNQFGYSNAGLSARRLVEEAGACPHIDAAGFNCGVGPGHMQRILRGIQPREGMFVTALPNAGYPQNLSNRMIFSNQNVEYFAGKVSDIAAEGVDIVGGCCGTTPEYIRSVNGRLARRASAHTWKAAVKETLAAGREDHAFYHQPTNKGKLIAVELAHPLGSDDEKLMDAAHLLKKSGVDVLTFPDSPSGRTRADSILMAEKVWRETGICVMPHICCRDKNAIAMRSQLLGAHINHIHNFLIITGDPIPSMVRSTVKSVFNFDSVGLMHIMADMNEEQFAHAPICYGGAINQGRRNLDVEIGRVRKKMEAGATFFLTQPVSTREGAGVLRRIKEETGARILCGVMPFVSLKNALFMKNEMTGIEVTEEVLARYREDMTREEGEAAGVALAKDVIAWTEDFVDGYYFSFPFNRVHMLEKILKDVAWLTIKDE